jgi:hypothetical protein
VCANDNALIEKFKKEIKIRKNRKITSLPQDKDSRDSSLVDLDLGTSPIEQEEKEDECKKLEKVRAKIKTPNKTKIIRGDVEKKAYRRKNMNTFKATTSANSFNKKNTEKSSSKEEYRLKNVEYLVLKFKDRVKGNDSVNKISDKDLAILCEKIEEELCTQIEIREKYDKKIKSIKFNIADAKNENFYMKILTGSIKPADLPGMESSEMASDEAIEKRNNERKKELEKIEQYTIEQNIDISKAVLAETTKKGLNGLNKEDCKEFLNNHTKLAEPNTNPTKVSTIPNKQTPAKLQKLIDQDINKDQMGSSEANQVSPGGKNSNKAANEAGTEELAQTLAEPILSKKNSPNLNSKEQSLTKTKENEQINKEINSPASKNKTQTEILSFSGPIHTKKQTSPQIDAAKPVSTTNKGLGPKIKADSNEKFSSASLKEPDFKAKQSESEACTQKKINSPEFGNLNANKEPFTSNSALIVNDTVASKNISPEKAMSRPACNELGLTSEKKQSILKNNFLQELEKDTTKEHDNHHLFELTCQICTGQIQIQPTHRNKPIEKNAAIDAIDDEIFSFNRERNYIPPSSPTKKMFETQQKQATLDQEELWKGLIDTKEGKLSAKATLISGQRGVHSFYNLVKSELLNSSLKSLNCINLEEMNFDNYLLKMKPDHYCLFMQFDPFESNQLKSTNIAMGEESRVSTNSCFDRIFSKLDILKINKNSKFLQIDLDENCSRFMKSFHLFPINYSSGQQSSFLKSNFSIDLFKDRKKIILGVLVSQHRSIIENLNLTSETSLLRNPKRKIDSNEDEPKVKSPTQQANTPNTQPVANQIRDPRLLKRLMANEPKSSAEKNDLNKEAEPVSNENQSNLDTATENEKSTRLFILSLLNKGSSDITTSPQGTSREHVLEKIKLHQTSSYATFENKNWALNEKSFALKVPSLLN